MDQTFKRRHFGDVKIGTIAGSEDETSSGGCCFKKKKVATVQLNASEYGRDRTYNEKFGDLGYEEDPSYSRKQRDIWGVKH